MKYKMLVCDYDMTLGIRPNIISEKNAEAVKRFQKAGGIFVLCTGRMLESIKNILDENGIICDMIAYQGSLIVDKKGETLLDGGIEAKDLLPFLRLAEENNEHINIYIGDKHWTNLLDKKTDFYKMSSRTEVYLLDEKPSEFIERTKSLCRKVALMDEHDCVEDKCAFYKDKFPSLEFNSGGYYLTEIVDKRYNKGNAVKFIAEKYGIPIEEVIAIGDSTNDISMIEAAGLGIAVGDGSEKLKSVAKAVAPPFKEDAVAYVIEKYCEV